MFLFSQAGVQYSGIAYGFFDLFGDIAGIYELIVGFFGLVLGTISYHSFVLSALKRLFLINVEDPDLFEYEKSENFVGKMGRN